MAYSTRRFVLCLTLCYFVLVFFSPFSNAITSLGEERANLSAFHTFIRFALVWFCLFPLPLGVWEGLRFVIVALPGLFSNLFFLSNNDDLSFLFRYYLLLPWKCIFPIRIWNIHFCTKFKLKQSIFVLLHVFWCLKNFLFSLFISFLHIPKKSIFPLLA